MSVQLRRRCNPSFGQTVPSAGLVIFFQPRNEGMAPGGIAPFPLTVKGSLPLTYPTVLQEPRDQRRHQGQPFADKRLRGNEGSYAVKVSNGSSNLAKR